MAFDMRELCCEAPKLCLICSFSVKIQRTVLTSDNLSRQYISRLTQLYEEKPETKGDNN